MRSPPWIWACPARITPPRASLEEVLDKLCAIHVALLSLSAKAQRWLMEAYALLQVVAGSALRDGWVQPEKTNGRSARTAGRCGARALQVAGALKSHGTSNLGAKNVIPCGSSMVERLGPCP